MNFKCPRCYKISEFSQEDLRKIFLKCPVCDRMFRPSECSPVMGGSEKKSGDKSHRNKKGRR